MKKLNIPDLFIPRYEIIAPYPDMKYKVNTVVTDDDLPCEPNIYPNLFRKLEWWERREGEVELLGQIEYARVVKYVGYFEEGAVVKVHSYGMNLTPHNVRLTGFYLGDNVNHFHPCDRVEPATEEEYKDYKNPNK